ncbi:MAG: hypothetical protein ACRDD1_07485 [Planctomycetia bacterium]
MSFDMGKTIDAKSDQLNSDDLVAGPRRIKIAKVTSGGSAEQPAAIHYEGDEGKPYKPCKTMRRLMVLVWGTDGAAYVGQEVILYRDDAVAFGGQQVGGIRISHMSGIDALKSVSLAVSKGKKKPFVVHPMPAESPPTQSGASAEFDRLGAMLKGAKTVAEIEGMASEMKAAIDAKKVTPEEAEKLRNRFVNLRKKLAPPKPIDPMDPANDHLFDGTNTDAIKG